MKKTVLFYLAIRSLLLTAQENEKSYIWPLDISNGISSTFQEFRANHFHAGMDLRTFQRTGYPVLAIADGVIERIGVSKTGMGSVIYLRHRDGNTSIYGHLEKFCDRIESLVVRERKRSAEKYFGRYALPEPIAVRQGEVIAFSGESGHGFPHLHLEIRDQVDGALNPLSWIGNPPEDDIAPRLKGIVLRSRGNFLLNDNLGEFYFKLRNNGLAYTLAEPLTVTGPFDLSMQAYDIAGGRQQVAPYSLEAYLDGQLYYRVVFERLVRDDNNQLGMLYDMAGSDNGVYFYKLFPQSGFAMEKGNSPFAENLGLLAPGEHEIRVIVKDRQQNQAVAVVPLRKFPSVERAFQKEYELNAGQRRVLADSDLSIYINRDDVVIKIKDFPMPPAWITLKILQGNQEQVAAAKEYSEGVFFCFKPLNDEMRVQLRFILSDGRQAVEELHKNILLLVLKSRTARQFRYGDFLADFAAGSVLEPTVLQLENVGLPVDYPMLAGPVSVAPVHFTFLDTVFFKFKIPRDQARQEQLGIFRYQASGKKWNYVQTQRVPEKEYLGCRVLSGGIFALLRDVDPPQISFRGRRVWRSEAHEKLVVRLLDRGKGIDEGTVAVFINGQKAECEYDPDWRHILIDATAGVRRGKNDLLVQAADFAGNRSVETFHFLCK
ncbi:MAG: M23 family metallopeptidase [Candidatus Aminicenantes bacterium]|nr:M23 family metallopeptidase [Candidatus Aminicenantes bacterium]